MSLNNLMAIADIMVFIAMEPIDSLYYMEGY